MTRMTLGRWYTAATLLFLVVLGVLFVIWLDASRDRAIAETEASFGELLTLARATAIELPGSAEARFDGAAYEQLLRGGALDFPRLQLLAVSAPGGDIGYLWSRSTAALGALANVTLTGARPRVEGTELAFEPDPVREHVRTEQIRFPGNELPPVRVSAVYTVLARPDLFIPLRNSLIAVLGFAVLAVLGAVVASFVEPGSRLSADDGAEPDRGSMTGAVSTKASVVDRDTGYSDTGPPEPYTPEEAAQAAPGPEARSADPELASASVPSGPRNTASAPPLFNPETGLGYRDHLLQRLGMELTRATENEQNLMLALIRFPGTDRDAGAYRAAASLVRQHFPYQDLAFEDSPDSFCVIFPGTGPNDSTPWLESLKAKLDADLSGDAVTQMGVSFQNGRIGDADRLLREARAALGRADPRNSPIVSFSPDPQKYRTYLNRGSRGENG